ncbi:hydrolase [Neptuniibacter sp. SY11_33]|uniref:hydrolase n=1 Tax=Neptuniibacter sp. SY11_33 TaxID=3398215 RepID=UPI0039F4C9F7
MQLSVESLDQLERDLLDKISAQQHLREQQLIELVEINSGSLNPQGINQVGLKYQELFAPLCSKSERVELPEWERIDYTGKAESQALGSLWKFSHNPDAPIQILFCGHTDTVFPVDGPFQHAIRLDHTRLNAPGAADMKGGILVILSALEALAQHPLTHQIGWSVVLNPDEEIGSPGSAAYLAEAAKQHDFGLIYEPALPDGNLAGERKGSGNFTLVVHGRSAHAGRAPETGRNAINKAAELILQLASLNNQKPGLTLNTGIIKAGETTNKVPDLAVCKFNVRIQKTEDAEWCLESINEFIQQHNQQEGFHIELHGHFGRYPKQLDQPHLALYQLVQQCSEQLGTALTWSATGGCCDGNNLSTAGLPNIDTLGVTGNFIHSPHEFINLPSLSSRAQLSALLLFHIAREGLPFKRLRPQGRPQ